MYKITLTIDGMKCGMCESHINDIIRKHFNIKKVTSNHRKSKTIILSENLITLKELLDVFDSTGYKILSYNDEVYQKKSWLF